MKSNTCQEVLVDWANWAVDRRSRSQGLAKQPTEPAELFFLPLRDPAFSQTKVTTLTPVQALALHVRGAGLWLDQPPLRLVLGVQAGGSAFLHVSSSPPSPPGPGVPRFSHSLGGHLGPAQSHTQD